MKKQDDLIKLGDRVQLKANPALDLTEDGATGKVVDIITSMVSSEPLVKFKRDEDIFNSCITVPRDFLKRIA